jgi:hypothetical protein
VGGCGAGWERERRGGGWDDEGFATRRSGNGVDKDGADAEHVMGALSHIQGLHPDFW